jgi:hypothetical protein
VKPRIASAYWSRAAVQRHRDDFEQQQVRPDPVGEQAAQAHQLQHRPAAEHAEVEDERRL